MHRCTDAQMHRCTDAQMQVGKEKGPFPQVCTGVCDTQPGRCRQARRHTLKGTQGGRACNALTNLNCSVANVAADIQNGFAMKPLCKKEGGGSCRVALGLRKHATKTNRHTDRQTDRQTRTDTDKNKPGGNVARRVSSKVLTRMVGCGRLCSRRCRCRCRCRCCLPSCTPSSVSSASRTRAAARVSPLASPASAASALAVPVLVVLVEDLSSCVRMLLLLRLRRLLRDAWLGRCWSPVSVL